MRNHKRDKKNIRSALSGKIINGREVILTEEAIDYVKNASSLSLTQRLAIVAIVLFIISILAYLGLNYINISSPTSSYTVGIIDFLLIILFTSLSYIKIWYLILIIAIIIAISYLFKNKT